MEVTEVLTVDISPATADTRLERVSLPALTISWTIAGGKPFFHLQLHGVGKTVGLSRSETSLWKQQEVTATGQEDLQLGHHLLPPIPPIPPQPL